MTAGKKRLSAQSSPSSSRRKILTQHARVCKSPTNIVVDNTSLPLAQGGPARAPLGKKAGAPVSHVSLLPVVCEFSLKFKEETTDKT
jgi:hypothetical protein